MSKYNDSNSFKTTNNGSNNTNTFNNTNESNNTDSYNTNSYNTTVYNIINGIETNEPDKVERPCLENFYKKSQGKVVRYYGYLTNEGIKVKGNVLFKVLNIVTSNGVFVDDHVWLDIKLLNYKDEYSRRSKEKGSLTGFIEFEGYVDDYIRKDKSKSYEIKIVNPVIFHLDDLESLGVGVYKLHEDDSLIKYSKYKRDNLFDLIDKLQEELNELINYYGENYLFFYVINLLTLNTAKENLYRNKIDRIPMSDKLLRNIITTLAALIYKIDTTREVNLKFLMTYITNIVNILQNITDYKIRSKEFERFCIDDLGIRPDSRTSEGLWEVVNYRQRNFGKNPNMFNLNIEDVSLQAWMVIQKYI
jgi:hypothetical protein